jgi:hypothetical protein
MAAKPQPNFRSVGTPGLDGVDETVPAPQEFAKKDS